MKSKKVKVIIKSSAKLKSEMVDALKGKTRSLQSEDVIVFNSAEAFTKILTANRLEILIHLTLNQPKSIYELAKNLNRDFKNVHTDVKKLFELDLIYLDDTGEIRRGLTPRAKYSEIDLKLSA